MTLQNPAPFPGSGQEYERRVRAQVDVIMAHFLRVLPSNYVSRVTGPFYMIQFQAFAETLARFIVCSEDVLGDADWTKTRPDFLWQLLGALVFPAASNRSQIPSVDGDVQYREFLKKMVGLLLAGSTADSMRDGAALLTESEVTLVERYIQSRSPGSAYTIDDQFFVDIFVEGTPDQPLPEEPFVLQENVAIILRALKPAHVLYGYSHLVSELFGTLFSDSYSLDINAYEYDDFRKYCRGVRSINGTNGSTLSGRTLFSDPTRDFSKVRVGGMLHVTSGANEGQYRVSEVLDFPVVEDLIPRAYTTSPTGLSGTATMSDGTMTDSTQDFSPVVEGETITVAAGPCAGTYRISTLLGSNGGPVGVATGPASSVRISKSILRVSVRMPVVTSSQSYSVDVDRLGVSSPTFVVGEDASNQFYR